tara:strand:+ start:446 stop:613 length:168 start_codon:yes stop_codon:yes gene_type:complete
MPTITKVCKNGKGLWRVDYAGMTRAFELSQEWDAHRFFDYVTECYAALSRSKASK